MTKRLRVIGMVAAALTILTGTVSAYSAETKSIRYSEFGVNEVYTCEAETIAEFFEEENIELEDGDKIILNEKETTDLNKTIRSGDEIAVKRAFYIDVVIDGEIYKTQVTGGNVADIKLIYADKLGESYELKSKYSDIAPLRREMELVFETTKQTVETVEQEIPFETEYVENSEMERGKENILQQGENGVKVYTYVKTYVGGKYTDIEESSEIVKEPVKQIVETGTKDPGSFIDGIKYVKALNMNSSAYTAYCSGSKRRTATGAEAVKGVAAVDTSVIPFGTKLYIPGYGYAVAADTGGAIRGNKIDLCMDSYDEAIQWGRRNVTVYILE